MPDPLNLVAAVKSDEPTATDAMLQAVLQHRVRNILSTVRSIFARTVANGDSLESVADHFQGRLDALSRHQGALTRDFDAFLDFETLIRDELSSFRFGDERYITIEGPELRMRGDATVVMALAIHELATNSIKFGVLSATEPRARLSITWDIADGRFRFAWRETGMPIVSAEPIGSGFGREYIEQALAYQIAAESTFVVRPGGIECTIAAPLAIFD